MDRSAHNPRRVGRYSMIVLLVVATAAGCGDDGTTGLESTSESGSGTTETEAPVVVEVPTTYVVVPTRLHSGPITPVDGSAGSISFEVSETDASTHETLAGGQVVVYDYVVEGLQVTLDLEDHPCGAASITEEITVEFDGGIAVDAGGRFFTTSDQIEIDGWLGNGASGTLTVHLPAEGSRQACSFGPASWSAESGF